MDNDFSFNSAIDRFRGEFDRISDETQSAYYNCDLPGFLYWYSLWRIANPMTRFTHPDKKYRNEYLTAIRLYEIAGTSVQPDILRQIHSIAMKFIADRPEQDKRKIYRGFLEKDFRTQILPAMEISSFVRKHLLCNRKSGIHQNRQRGYIKNCNNRTSETVTTVHQKR